MLVNKLQLKDRNNINGIIRHDSFFLKLNLFQFSTNVLVNYINAISINSDYSIKPL